MIDCNLDSSKCSQLLSIHSLLGEMSPCGRSESPDDDSCHNVPPIKRSSKRKLSGNSQSDRSPDSNTNSLCAREERFSPRRSRERAASPGPQFINNTGKYSFYTILKYNCELQLSKHSFIWICVSCATSTHPKQFEQQSSKLSKNMKT